MKLSELSKEQLEIGTKLISATGSPGEITEIDKDSREDWTIRIQWENGGCSVIWHSWGEHIKVVEESNAD